MGDSIAQPLLADEVALLSAHEAHRTLSAQMQRHVDRTLAADRKGGEALWEKACAVADARQDAQHGEWGNYLQATGQNDRAAQRLIAIASKGRAEGRFRDAIISGFLSFSVAAITAQADDLLLETLLANPKPPSRREVEALTTNPTPVSGLPTPHPAAPVAIAPEPIEEEDDPEPGPDARYCKYCYTKHSDWCYTGGNRWECGRCNHGSWREEPEEEGDPDDPAPIPLEPEPQPAPPVVETANHQRINLSTSNEWYTPRAYVDAARVVMGRIDLDPASCAFANQAVGASRFYTQADDGYALPWAGTVWLNPPYGREDGESDSNQARWTRRAIDAYRSGEIEQAIILVNAVPGNVWFAPLWDFPICMVARRIRFYNEHVEAGQPTHSNAIIYLGSRIAAFVQAFTPFGPVVSRLAADGDAYYPNLRGEA